MSNIRTYKGKRNVCRSSNFQHISRKQGGINFQISRFNNYNQQIQNSIQLACLKGNHIQSCQQNKQIISKQFKIRSFRLKPSTTCQLLPVKLTTLKLKEINYDQKISTLCMKINIKYGSNIRKTKWTFVIDSEIFLNPKKFWNQLKHSRIKSEFKYFYSISKLLAIMIHHLFSSYQVTFNPINYNIKLFSVLQKNQSKHFPCTISHKQNNYLTKSQQSKKSIKAHLISLIHQQKHQCYGYQLMIFYFLIGNASSKGWIFKQNKSQSMLMMSLIQNLSQITSLKSQSYLYQISIKKQQKNKDVNPVSQLAVNLISK